MTPLAMLVGTTDKPHLYGLIAVSDKATEKVGQLLTCMASS